MIILGIDPGTATTGFAIIEVKKNQSRLLSSGCIITSKEKTNAERLEIIYKDICKIILDFKPKVLACEKIFFFKNAKTVISVAQARGVILLAGKLAGLKVAEYTPLQVKQALTSYGRADKQQIQEMTKTLLNLKFVLRPDDAADAAAVAICHTMTRC